MSSTTTGIGDQYREYTITLTYLGTTPLTLSTTTPLTFNFLIPISSNDINLYNRIEVYPKIKLVSGSEQGPTTSLFPPDAEWDHEVILTTLPRDLINPTLPTATITTPTQPQGAETTLTPAMCEQCNVEQTAACDLTNVFDTCTCKDTTTFDGPNCTAPTACTQLTEDLCASDHSGFVDIKPDGRCANECTCVGNWIGLGCATCSLECQHGGRPYRNCQTCGCPKGFSGPTCQCRSLIGTIILAQSNPLLINTQGRLYHVNSEPQSPPVEQDQPLQPQQQPSLPQQLPQLLTMNHTTSQIDLSLFSPLPTIATDTDRALFVLMRDLYEGLIEPLTTKSISNGGKMMITAEPTDDNKSTLFTFTIIYSCDESNPHWSNQDDVQAAWDSFTEIFSSLEVIKLHFKHPDDLEEDLVITSATLPLPAEEAIPLIYTRNGAVGLCGSTLVLFVFVLLMVLGF